MKNSSLRYGKYSLVLLATLAPGLVLAAGFEKSVLWSGKHAGKVGAAVADVQGAQSVLFNPSGLAAQERGGEVTLNLSPTLSNFESPTPITGGPSVEGRQQFSPIFGGLVSFPLTDKLGIGGGYFVSGGTRARFPNLALGGAYQPTVETDLSVTEASIGAGYEIMPGLRIGAAWRYVMVDANFAFANAAPGNAIAYDLEANRWNAFRAGLQYTSADRSWGLGANYRSGLEFIAKGKFFTRSGAGATAPIDVDVYNNFPLQVSLGGFFQVTPTLKLFPEYSFTNYSENDRITVVPVTTVSQNWQNQHVVRLGSEFLWDQSTTLRAGYAWTSQVTPEERARSTFASPGNGHTLTVGAGHSYMNDMLEVNAALEHSFASGQGRNTEEGITTNREYSTKAYALHLGVTYRL